MPFLHLHVQCSRELHVAVSDACIVTWWSWLLAEWWSRSMIRLAKELFILQCGQGSSKSFGTMPWSCPSLARILQMLRYTTDVHHTSYFVLDDIALQANPWKLNTASHIYNLIVLMEYACLNSRHYGHAPRCLWTKNMYVALVFIRVKMVLLTQYGMH